MEKELKGMRSAIHSNFLLPRRSPTVTRISPSLGAFSRRSFDFLKNFGSSRNSPDLAAGREIIDRCMSRSSNDNMPNMFEKSKLFNTPYCSPRSRRN